MPDFNLQKTISEVENRLPSQEHVLGKGLMQPFRNTNSSSRCIMQGIQKEQTMEIAGAEVPIISTGYENRFGEVSSSFVRTDKNYVVVDKISKFPNDRSKLRKYMIILLDPENNVISCIERSGYNHITESYGYTYNNTTMDSLKTGDLIPAGTVIKKSSEFDEYDNRQDGVNLSTVYMASGLTIEDPIVISESAAKKFQSPLFDKVRVIVNDNDIILNLYGGNNQDEYKAFPDIGEEVKDGILCAVRRENKDDEALFAQSWENLKHVMISDESYVVSGTVIDVDVFCNNPEALQNSVYNQQIYRYYKAQKEYCKKIVDCVDPLLKRGLKMDYEMDKFYTYCKDVLNNVQYINENVFNNIIMNITTMRTIPLVRGDKITDRYGGKGVISKVLPDELMPKKLNTQGVWEPIDIQYNSSTCVNRENPGQLFETSITFVGSQIIERIVTHKVSMETAKGMIKTFLDIVSPDEGRAFQNTWDSLIDDEDKYIFIRSIINDGNIYCVIKPSSPHFGIDDLTKLYEVFPFVKQSPIQTVIRDSNGNYRNVIARRPLTTGYKYIYRLKQFAEEKFSAVSLASTNIKGENSKSKASKQHKILFSSTPVRFGEMEWEDLIHIQAVEQVIQVLMLLSSSPGARKLNQQLLTSDPFNVDIKLDDKSTSRSVEIVNAYLKEMGLAIVIEKIPKHKNRALRVVAYKVPGKHILKDIVEKKPLDVMDKDITRIYNAMVNSGKFATPIAAKVDHTKFKSQEDLDRYWKVRAESQALHVINRYRDLEKSVSIDAMEKDILDQKKDKIKEKPLQIVSRVIAKRVPNPNRK